MRELGSGVEGAEGSRKCEEEGIHLRVDLDSAVLSARLAYCRPVRGERICVVLRPEFV